jgi:protein TonB
MFDIRSAIVALSIHVAALAGALFTRQPAADPPPARVIYRIDPFSRSETAIPPAPGGSGSDGAAADPATGNTPATAPADQLLPAAPMVESVPTPAPVSSTSEVDPSSDVSQLVGLGKRPHAARGGRENGGTGIGTAFGDGQDKGQGGALGYPLASGEVDRAVEPIEFPPPTYPPALRAAEIGGEVVARYVVDTTGRVEPESVEILRSTHAGFNDAVRAGLRRARFRPALSGRHRVRQLVEQGFRFVVTR